MHEDAIACQLVIPGDPCLLPGLRLSMARLAMVSLDARDALPRIWHAGMMAWLGIAINTNHNT